MEGVGWEIRPAGWFLLWFLLFVVAALLIYYIVKWRASLRMRTRKKPS